MPHRAMAKDNVAVITGGASGIGLASAMHFAALGMKVCIADIGDEALKAAEARIAAASPGGGANVMAAKVDVSSRDELIALEARRAKTVRRHRHPDEQCRHLAGRKDVRPAGQLAAPARGQSVGRHPRHAGVRAAHDRARPAGADHQHRLQAGHHHAAGRACLQCQQGRGEGVHRGAAARAAQHRRLQDQRASPDPRSRLHGPDRARPHREAAGRLDAASRPSTS